MVAGKTTDEQTGGYIALTTGFSKFTSSGNLFLTTVNAGKKGVSGWVM